TTRNTMSGSVYGLNTFPDQYDKLIAHPGLVPKLVPEIIRWQTPLSYMRRTATRDCEIRDKKILEGDQILMWYVSANRDEDVFENANVIDIERHNADRHLSFGYGIHFCMGSRLAELRFGCCGKRSSSASSASRSKTSRNGPSRPSCTATPACPSPSPAAKGPVVAIGRSRASTDI
ncbi:unnamed protein product, partial [marine sediment metagenome]